MSSGEGKVAIVTGSGTGIGRAIAIGLAKEGWTIVITGRNVEGLQETVNLCIESNSAKSKLFQISADITVEKECGKIITETVKKFGRLDLLVNNAGVLENKSYMETTLEDFKKIFNVNVAAVFLLSKLAMPELAKTKGNIINISSSASSMHTPVIAAYCTSKATVDHMTGTFAIEGAEFGVRVNSLNPAFVDGSTMYTRTGVPQGEVDQLSAYIAASTPLKRNCSMEDVVNGVLFLVSEKSSYIAGHSLVIDGGMNVKPPL